MAGPLPEGDDTSEDKIDIFTPLMQAATQLHELVVEFESAGFSRAEAIQIVLEMMKNTGGA